MEKTTFAELGLPEPLLEAITEIGFEEPSAIQAATIPVALAGHDIVGLSQTGSGKTAAFGLPSLAKVDVDLAVPQLIVLCPTRELAVQVCDEINRLGAKTPKLKTVAIYGGAPITRQIRALNQGAQVIVGTPGRIIDHVERGSLELFDIETVILDEADRMLDMGFQDEMEKLLRALPEDRQTLFFSATMNKQVQRLIHQHSDDPQTIEIERATLTVDSIDQVVYEVRQRSKTEVLSRILDLEQPRLAIIFCNTKKAVDDCTEALLARGYPADRLHGDIAQMLRERVIRLFREGTVEILVATDVAARGIDIDDIDMVINYDLPQDPEDYVHRIGRTGRAGRSGRAVSFVFGRDVYRLQTIERYTRQQITRAPIPSTEEVEGRLASQLIDTVREKLQSKAFEDASADINTLKEEGHSEYDIANALMALLREETGRESEEILEDRPDYEAPSERRPRRERDGDDRGGRDDRKRERRQRDNPTETEEGMTRLFMNLGKAHRARPGDIVGMMHNELGIPRDSLGRITMAPRFSLIEIADEFADTAIEEAKTAKLRGKKFILDRDRASGSGGASVRDDSPPADRPERPDRPDRPPRKKERDENREWRSERGKDRGYKKKKDFKTGGGKKKSYGGDKPNRKKPKGRFPKKG